MVIVRSALQNFRKWGRSPRIWALALLMLVFANNPARALCQAAEESGKALSPWLLPFLFHRRAHRNPRLSARIQRVKKSAFSGLTDREVARIPRAQRHGGGRTGLALKKAR